MLYNQSTPLMFMCLNIGRIDEVIYKYFCIVLGLTQPRGVRPKFFVNDEIETRYVIKY